jgi:hypothetical protein
MMGRCGAHRCLQGLHAWTNCSTASLNPGRFGLTDNLTSLMERRKGEDAIRLNIGSYTLAEWRTAVAMRHSA